jgi:hypothetical protein
LTLRWEHSPCPLIQSRGGLTWPPTDPALDDGYGPRAQELGATAVVGIQYDATEVIQGATEVLCYGTAIVAVRV